MQGQLFDKFFISQFWYWAKNVEIISNQKVLNEDAEKLFRELYKTENIKEGRLDFNYVKTFIFDSKHLLNLDAMKMYMSDSVSFLKIVEYVYNLEIDNSSKQSIVMSLVDMPVDKISVLESMKSKVYTVDSLFDFITTNITKISSSKSGKQYDEIDEFLKFAEKIYGNSLNYNACSKQIKMFFEHYIGLHTLFVTKSDLTKQDVYDYIKQKSKGSTFLLVGLKSLKMLKIDDSKKLIKLEDLLKLFEDIGLYSSAEHKCKKSFIIILNSIKKYPERYYLADSILTHFGELYNLDELVKAPTTEEEIDLKKYLLVKEQPKEEHGILSAEENEELKNNFSIDTYKKIIYILCNPDEAEKNKDELIISIKNDELEDFIDYINSKLGFFFGPESKIVYIKYNDMKNAIASGIDIDKFLLDNLNVKDLHLYLRWLKIESPMLNKKYEFNDLVFLLHRKKAFILSVKELEKELKIIAENPFSYLYGHDLINYVKDIYHFDVEDKDQSLVDIIYKSRKVEHSASKGTRTLDLVQKAFEKYTTICPKYFDFEDVLIFALNYEYHDEENDKYYYLSVEDIKATIKKVAKDKYKEKIGLDFHDKVEEYSSIKTSDIKSLLVKARSFKEMLKILELRKKLNGEKGVFSNDDIAVFDKYLLDNNFYSETNYYSLMKFYEKLRYESKKYAYSRELINYYEDLIKKKANKIDLLAPNVELIEKKTDEDTLGYKIINRIIPTSSEEKKRSLTAVISGIGVISLLTMTIVLAVSPITAIESCASSFSGLLAHPSLSGLIHSIGSPLLYFGAIYESIRGFTKNRFKNVYDIVTDELEEKHR